MWLLVRSPRRAQVLGELRDERQVGHSLIQGHGTRLLLSQGHRLPPAWNTKALKAELLGCRHSFSERPFFNFDIKAD